MFMNCYILTTACPQRKEHFVPKEKSCTKMSASSVFTLTEAVAVTSQVYTEDVGGKIAAAAGLLRRA